MELNYVFFSCIHYIDWSQQPVNDIVTSSMELRGQKVPLEFITYIADPYTDEAFVDIQLGPIICTAGMYP